MQEFFVLQLKHFSQFEKYFKIKFKKSSTSLHFIECWPTYCLFSIITLSSFHVILLITWKHLCHKHCIGYSEGNTSVVRCKPYKCGHALAILWERSSYEQKKVCQKGQKRKSESTGAGLGYRSLHVEDFWSEVSYEHRWDCHSITLECRTTGRRQGG